MLQDRLDRGVWGSGDVQQQHRVLVPELFQELQYWVAGSKGGLYRYGWLLFSRGELHDGLYAQQGGQIVGTANNQYSGNTTNENAVAGSFGYID